MTQKRKLQVFVSSTFTDLKEERQAAVEAILKAGHIPAGMELFGATDKSQMDVIKKWIDESDAYLLLLGGRYGSIEPNSGKSYTQLEYEYAIEKGKAYFSIVIKRDHLDQKVSKIGKDVLELENPQKYNDFYKLATGRMVEFWGDLRDIKLAIHTTLSEFSDRPELVGWVPGSEATNSGAIAEEIARLTKENANLREKLSKSLNNSLYNGLTFDEICSLLSQFSFIDYTTEEKYLNILNMIAEAFGDETPTLLHFFYQLKMNLSDRQDVKNSPSSLQWAIHKLAEFNILSFTSQGKQLFMITADGYQFSLRLQVEHNVSVNDVILKKYRPPGISWDVS